MRLFDLLEIGDTALQAAYHVFNLTCASTAYLLQQERFAFLFHPISGWLHADWPIALTPSCELFHDVLKCILCPEG